MTIATNELLTIAIQRVKLDISLSNARLEYLVGSELTRENYHCGNLHLELRKLTAIANQNKTGFWCSVCGEMYKTARLRVAHVSEDHLKI